MLFRFEGLFLRVKCLNSRHFLKTSRQSLNIIWIGRMHNFGFITCHIEFSFSFGHYIWVHELVRILLFACLALVQHKLTSVSCLVVRQRPKQQMRLLLILFLRIWIQRMGNWSNSAWLCERKIWIFVRLQWQTGFSNGHWNSLGGVLVSKGLQDVLPTQSHLVSFEACSSHLLYFTYCDLYNLYQSI